MVDICETEVVPACESSFRKPSVLIVEDDETQTAALVHRLESQGYETLTTSAGDDGVLLARLHQPRLVLLDLGLPDRDGFDVCTELTDDQRTCHIPVIILSASDRPDVIRKCRAAGSTYFVRKPYDPNVLLTLIENSLGDELKSGW